MVSDMTTTSADTPVSSSHRQTGPRSFSVNRQLVDVGAVALAVILGVVALLVGFDDGERPDGPEGYAIALAGCAFLFGRRLAPVPVLGGVMAARLLLITITGNEHALMPAAAIAVYTVVRWGRRRSALPLATLVVVVMALATAALSDEPFLFELLPEIAVGLLPVAVGDAVRVRADRLNQLIENKVSARVQAERLRIAHDLHDTVAHGLSTIAVQSGVAAHLLDDKPEQAREALEIINGTCTSALQELRGLVGVLRSTDDVPLRPIPTDPDDLSDLLVSATESGADVTVTVDGVFPADVSDGAVVAVHRIVEEALANVVRHAGPVATTVSLVHGEDQAVVEVTNEAPGGRPPAAPSTGVGIVGMRERAEALGGSLDAGPANGGFRVVARVPYHGIASD